MNILQLGNQLAGIPVIFYKIGAGDACGHGEDLHCYGLA